MHNFFLKSFASLKWIPLLLLFILLTLYFILYASLPDLDGTKVITLLNQPVQIARDAQGIPTIRAKNRQDTTFTLGYVHAQERYFQMDLLRRRAAGELAELFGDKALKQDKKVKLHRFRERAERAIRNLSKAHYASLMAYSNGVNTGIEALTNDPYPYLLLRQRPEPWQPEDSLLCIYAMYFDLNDELIERKKSLAILQDELPKKWFEFLTPKGGIWDAAMDGSKLSNAQPSIPATKLPDFNFPPDSKHDYLPDSSFNLLAGSNSNLLPGSNSWVIDNSLSSYASAMLASDVHLALRVPNIWYRASWYLDDGRRVTGVTLPGMPAMVIGSNENIAWSFTNSYGDWGDIITLKTNDNNTQYYSSDGWKDFKLYSHVIYSSSGHSEDILSIDTDWGPVIGRNHKGELIVYQWIAHAPQAVNLNFLEAEESKSVDDALDFAPTMGLPTQSMLIADSNGHIAWTIAGPIPKRDSKRLNKGWQSYQAEDDYPTFIDPDNHRLWSANNRLVSGEKLSMIGFEGGDLGARAQQIRDGLLAKEQFKEADLLAIQLDTRAVFLRRWKQLLLNSLERKNSPEHKNSPEYKNSPGQNNSPERAVAKSSNTPEQSSRLQMIEILNRETDLAARPDSVAYGLVKVFRQNVINQSIGWIYDALENKHPGLFKRSSVDKFIEYPVWALISQKPQHLIPPAYKSWQDFFIASAEKSYNDITNYGQLALAQQNWGKLHRYNIRHPLSNVIPGLGMLVDMPDSPLSGDDNMPKVSGSQFGASMRMVVSPGQEKNGIMHMPGSQSSHPLSPYYSSGHQDWLKGEPSAFLPGKTKWLLELKSF